MCVDLVVVVDEWVVVMVLWICVFGVVEMGV